MRLFVLIVPCLALLVSCGFEPQRDDQLDQLEEPAVHLLDGGVSLLGLYDPPAQPAYYPDAGDHTSCHSPCPEACSTDEICCLNTLRCIPISCPDCCPGYASLGDVRPIGL